MSSTQATSKQITVFLVQGQAPRRETGLVRCPCWSSELRPGRLSRVATTEARGTGVRFKRK